LGCNSSGTNCSSCVDNYSLNDTTCISNDQCLLNGYIYNGTCQGFFFKKWMTIKEREKKNDNKMIGCNLNCSTCNGPTSENCLSCHESKYLLDEKCVDSCPSTYYHDDSTKSCQSEKVKQQICNNLF